MKRVQWIRTKLQDGYESTNLIRGKFHGPILTMIAFITVDDLRMSLSLKKSKTCFLPDVSHRASCWNTYPSGVMGSLL